MGTFSYVTRIELSSLIVHHKPRGIQLSIQLNRRKLEYGLTLLFCFLFRFFEFNPENQKLFPEFKDVDPSELENTSALYGHAKRVMKAVENAVSSLDDAFSFAAYLEELGRRHKARALKPSYLDVS